MGNKAANCLEPGSKNATRLPEQGEQIKLSPSSTQLLYSRHMPCGPGVGMVSGLEVPVGVGG